MLITDRKRRFYAIISSKLLSSNTFNLNMVKILSFGRKRVFHTGFEQNAHLFGVYPATKRILQMHIKIHNTAARLIITNFQPWN